ncbi:MAG: DUF362 domain-containing protein [Patescibacteria group bacterium]
MSKIAFISSNDRKYNIERALSLIKGEIISGLRGAKSVVVKPNCVHEDIQLSSTHVDALDALLNFISPYVKSQIILAEGTGEGNTITAFENYGYFSLQEKYDLALVDLNTDEFETIEILDKKNNKIRAQFSKTLLNSDYLISIALPKTHNEVIYTGAIKNVAVGGLIKPYFGLSAKLGMNFSKLKDNKSLIHQGTPALNENIATLFEHIKLKLSVLDGFECMEGEGPVHGDMVPAHYSIVSSDPLAADWLACNLMNIKIEDIGYLSLLGAGDINNHFIIGDDWREHIVDFKKPKDFERIRKWR